MINVAMCDAKQNSARRGPIPRLNDVCSRCTAISTLAHTYCIIDIFRLRRYSIRYVRYFSFPVHPLLVASVALSQ